MRRGQNCLLRYSPGEMPAYFLNTLEKCPDEENPRYAAMALTDRSEYRSSRFASDVFSSRMKSVSVFPVSSPNRAER